MKLLALVLLLLFCGNVLCDEWGYEISGERTTIKSDGEILLDIKNQNWVCKISAFDPKDLRNYRTLECINQQNFYLSGVLLECNNDYNSDTLYLSPIPVSSKSPRIFIEIKLYCTNTESPKKRKVRTDKQIDKILNSDILKKL